ncbi:NADPH:quinone oxidoreductase family protein [Brevibacterium sp. CS2]|uniref:NADPH:quinone oxidoreductase family protein n=1 Tax=Brevibacterium sp. CS2 TaxID=2575923 RepID=UPI0010C79FBE|nr:NADPH:quinone oxidoreductase family protein [Brevibacterium sp. CS2]QCP04994.1 NADPH:quinone oxidoreductase family protein [Brevibacterium sp. CS2]
MKAIHVTRLDGPEAVEFVDAERPTPGPGEVLIEVAVAGVTFPELLQTRGMYQVRHELPFVLGSEAAGTVVEVGEGSRFSVGDRVAAITGKGTFAEYLVAADQQTVKVPDSVSLAHAAGMPMNLLTADFSLRVRGNVQPGQTVLVHGAAGGLGSAGVQLALAMGLEVVAVVSTDDKAAMVKELGAHHVVKAEGFKDAVLEIFPDGVDVVYDPVGGDRFTDSLRCLKRFGHLQVLGFTAGEIPTVKVNRLLLKNISVVGVAWGEATRGNPNLIAEQWEVISEHVAAGRLNPHIHATYPLEQAGAAISELDNRAVLGKVLLEVKPES